MIFNWVLRGARAIRGREKSVLWRVNDVIGDVQIEPLELEELLNLLGQVSNQVKPKLPLQ